MGGNSVVADHGEFENPKKSAYSLEYYDSSWEREHMEVLESDERVKKWTKNHGIRILYRDSDGEYHQFEPDFLVELTDGSVEIHEVKGVHILNNPITRSKSEAATKWCKDRGMKYRLISKHK
jgi:hypothetical protein